MGWDSVSPEMIQNFHRQGQIILVAELARRYGTDNEMGKQDLFKLTDEEFIQFVTTKILPKK